MFSRIQSVGKIIDASKFNELEEKRSYVERNVIPFDASNYGFFHSFVPPPPRMPSMGNLNLLWLLIRAQIYLKLFLKKSDIVSDGLTTCDSCVWASMHDDKSYFSLEGHKGGTFANLCKMQYTHMFYIK